MEDALAAWANPILENLIAHSGNYADKALLEVMQAEIKELDKRTQQAEGQIDGIGWDKEDW